MTSPLELKEKTDSTSEGLLITECVTKQFEYNRFLYSLVGSNWQWTDKLSWSDEEWRSFAESNNLRTWVAYRKGTPAGYFELQMQEAGVVEIASFGLTPRFMVKVTAAICCHKRSNPLGNGARQGSGSIPVAWIIPMRWVTIRNVA